MGVGSWESGHGHEKGKEYKIDKKMECDIEENVWVYNYKIFFQCWVGLERERMDHPLEAIWV